MKNTSENIMDLVGIYMSNTEEMTDFKYGLKLGGLMNLRMFCETVNDYDAVAKAIKELGQIFKKYKNLKK